MSLNLRYMLEGTPIRMRYTFRWATSRVSFPENVAEHSWFVCFYAMMVARWCATVHGYGPIMSDEHFLGVVLQKAVLHDIEEARSGDIHRPFKYSNVALRESLKKAGLVAAEQTILPLTANQSEKDELLRIWERAKDDSPEGKIVRFADMLAVLAFLKQEGSAFGSGTSSHSMVTLPAHMEEFKKPEFDFIRPLVEEAERIMQEVLNGSSSGQG